jgi:hypothetical protein
MNKLTLGNTDGYITPHGFDQGQELLVPCSSCPGGIPCRCLALGLRVLPKVSEEIEIKQLH